MVSADGSAIINVKNKIFSQQWLLLLFIPGYILCERFERGEFMGENKKITLSRIAVSLLISVTTFLPLFPININIWLYVAAYLIMGADVIWKAVKNIVHGNIFDENFLMSIATIGALAIGEYPEAVAVMLFYQIGELFHNSAVKKSRASIASLMELKPDYANVELNGKLVQIKPEEVTVGDIIVVKPGEKIPIDGIIISGSTSLSTTALTGESIPRDVEIGDEVLSGCVNISGLLRIKTINTFGESAVSKILDLVENADNGKATTEKFITRFARYYTPIVVIIALILAIIPPLFLSNHCWMDWINRSLVFLVISCPCALVVSVPLSFFGGIGSASKIGVLVKGSNYIESLAKSEIVVFDKTGTLTKGNFTATSVHSEKITEEQLIEYAALAECYSDHPISESLIDAYGKEIDKSIVKDVENIAGYGVKTIIGGQTIYVGNSKLMNRINAKWKPCNQLGTIVHVVVNNVYMGHIVISDEIKPDSQKTIAALKESGIKKIVMLTGDHKDISEEIARELKVDELHSELLPNEKVEQVEKLLKEKTEKGKLIFVGDGINDAPVLKRADVGIAMGAIGSDAAIEAADVVLMDDSPFKIAKVINISRKTLKIVTQNICFALSVKGFILILSAFGIANMWEAVFADVGVFLLATLNALRTIRTKV